MLERTLESLKSQARAILPPRVHSGLRVLLGRPHRGGQYRGASPRLKLIKGSGAIMREVLQRQLSSRASAAPVEFLDLGGGHGRDWVRQMVPGSNYSLLDIEPRTGVGNVIQANICECPEIPDGRFDVIFSDSVFEHIEEPWRAAKEIGRILKPGGVCLTRTLFSWRYHPCPEDYWRYTHSALKMLFQKHGGLETLDCGYDIGNRRMNFLGGKQEGNEDGLPQDGYGGWLEGWMVYHVGRKNGQL